jgi:hypothetical protein
MKKANLNLIIDGILFVLMGLLTGVGLLIKYVLLSGEDRWIKYGKNVNITFLDLDRHQWGKIHLIVAIILIVFLILHIVFHWKMIVCLCKGFISNKIFRILVVLVLTILTIVFTVFPFFIKTTIDDLDSGSERFNVYSEHANSDTIIDLKNTKKIKSSVVAIVDEKHKDEHHNIDPSIEVKGFMTLQEVSDKYEVPCAKIKEALDIPISTSNTRNLGYLRKQYNFKMSDVELIIVNYKK